MTGIAARLDPCLNWFRVLARTRGRILWIFPALLLVGYVVALRHGDPIGGFFYRFSEKNTNTPLLRQARELNLGYEQVVAKPQDYVGKPVVWCVASGDGRSGFVATRQTWPIAWTDPSDKLKTDIGSHGWCWNMLAVIEGVEQGIVKLRPVERI
ncbi:MAG: hypothetical protein ACHQ49_02315 [Elusimicrobiota bacterium]